MDIKTNVFDAKELLKDLDERLTHEDKKRILMAIGVYLSMKIVKKKLKKARRKK